MPPTLARAMAGRWRHFLPFARNLALTVGVGILLFVVFYILNRLKGAPRSIAGHAVPVVDPTLLVLLEALGIVLVGYLFARTLNSIIEGYTRIQGRVTRITAARLLVNLVVGLLVLIGVFDVFGVSATNIFLGSAFLGIVLGLAGQSMISNVLAGVQIVLSNPFTNGERIAVVSSQYGAMSPSYAHEVAYPTYTGTVRDTGLLYTVLTLDNGQLAEFPNSVISQALVINLTRSPMRTQRIRFTLPITVPIGAVESAVRRIEALAGTVPEGGPPPRFDVVDVSKDTWDGVVIVWTTEPDESIVRDRVLRAVLPALPSSVTSPPAAPK
jgi:small-conductance mechanosensitive channel